MQLSKKIKICRQENHLTQAEFADSLNVSRKTVSGWENDRSFPDITTLIKISDNYDISLDSLLKDSETVDYYQTQIEGSIKNQKRILPLYLILMVSSILLFIQFLTEWKLPFHIVIIVFLITLVSYLINYPFNRRANSIGSLIKLSTLFIIIFIVNATLFVVTGNLATSNDVYWNYGIIIGAIFLNFLLSLAFVILISFIPRNVTDSINEFNRKKNKPS